MSPDDRPAIRRLMEAAFGSEDAARTPQTWEWLFGESPAHAATRYLVADAGDRLAGQFVGIPVRMQHGGAPARGLMVVDMATDPAFRKQGVFTALARRLYAESAEDASIVFGFPNPTAAPIHYGRFDWVELRPFPLLIRPLGNVRRALAASGSALAPLGRLVDVLGRPLQALEHAVAFSAQRSAASVLPLEAFSSWTDELWAGLAPELGTCAVRDARYLNWRFCASPHAYRRYALHRNGRPVGFAVTTSTSSPRFGDLCFLMELMAPAGDSAGARLLLAHVFMDALNSGASGVCTLATARHPHRRTMRRAGFLPAASRLRAQLSFGVRRNAPRAIPNELFHIDDWYLSGADYDTL
jgi:GNAT superfamily N-acetyltransferase